MKTIQTHLNAHRNFYWVNLSALFPPDTVADECLCSCAQDYRVEVVSLLSSICTFEALLICRCYPVFALHSGKRIIFI